MKPRRHRARGRAAIVFPARGKKGKFGAIFLVLGLRRGWGGVQGLPTGVRAGDKISEACPCRSARPRAAAPLQKFCAALIRHWRHRMAKLRSSRPVRCCALTTHACFCLAGCFRCCSRAEARLDQQSKGLVSPATQHIKAIGGEDEALSRALRNFRAKKSQTERSISWASRLPLSASISNVLSELELAFSTMRVWKIVDGSLVATAAHSIWSASDSLELPFETNGVAGTIKMGKDSVYECIVDGETMPEDAQLLPPSISNAAGTVKICTEISPGVSWHRGAAAHTACTF